MRQRMSLDGVWEFITDPTGNLRIDKLTDELPWRKINVPSFWEAQFEDLLNYDGIAWYRRDVTLPNEWLELLLGGQMRIFIHFEAVDYYAQLFIEEQLIGEHEGGYLPFEFEFPGELITKLGKQTDTFKLTVRVIDPTNDRLRFPRFPADEIPMGKQKWYLNVGGIWQSVWFELRPHTFIEDVFVTPLKDLKHAEVKVKLSQAAETKMHCELLVEDADGVPTAHASTELPIGEREFTVRMQIENAKAWHPDEPNIYRLRVRLNNGDELSTAFGLRTVECRNGKVLINGEPIYIIGALDQDFYADGIYRAPSDELLESQFNLAKDMGFNLLRCHLKIPERRYLDVADKVGMLIWYEVPSWTRFGERLRQRVKRHLHEMVRRDYNHPSLIAYGIVGESWGLKLSEQELHRRWLVEVADLLRQLDGTRLIVDNSPCHGNFHIKTDICDFHIYCNSPDEDERFSKWLDEFQMRPHWTFSPYGDAHPSGDEPLIVSEFGIWGLPDVDAQIALHGKLPWWFNTGSGACRPEGVHERFQNSRLANAFGSFGELCKATRLHQAEALRHQIEQIRMRGNITGYVITELTDVAWECNGMLDFMRNEKEAAKALKGLQSQDMLIISLNNECAFGGDLIAVNAFLSHYSCAKIDGATLRLRLLDELGNTIGENELDGISVERGQTRKVAECELILCDADMPSWFTAELELNHDGISLMAKKRFLVFPSSWRMFNLPHDFSAFIHDPYGFFNGTEEELSKRGVKIAGDCRSADLVIASFPDSEIIKVASEGSKVLCIVEMAHAIAIPIDGVRIVDRGLKGRWGSWCTSFIWLSARLRQMLSLPAILPHAMRGIVPRCVVEVDESKLGCERCNMQVEEMHSGIFVGWLHEQASLALKLKVGDGKMLLTTFPIASKLACEPSAIGMMRAMIQLSLE